MLKCVYLILEAFHMFISQLGFDIITVFTNPTILTSLILVIVGLSLSFLSARITRMVRKSSEVRSDDKLLVILRAIGLVLIVLGMLILIVMLITL